MLKERTEERQIQELREMQEAAEASKRFDRLNGCIAGHLQTSPKSTKIIFSGD